MNGAESVRNAYTKPSHDNLPSEEKSLQSKKKLSGTLENISQISGKKRHRNNGMLDEKSIHDSNGRSFESRGVLTTVIEEKLKADSAPFAEIEEYFEEYTHHVLTNVVDKENICQGVNYTSSQSDGTKYNDSEYVLYSKTYYLRDFENLKNDAEIIKKSRTRSQASVAKAENKIMNTKMTVKVWVVYKDREIKDIIPYKDPKIKSRG